jgi:hypothetical protein
MRAFGLEQPLLVARAAVQLENELMALGLKPTVSSDMRAFNTTKTKVRGFEVAPMHHFEVGVFGQERAFWMGLTDASGECVGLQGFRYDEIDTHLADWCVTYMIGAYMRRGEMMVPSHVQPPKGSISERLTGKLVYHGEIWLEKQIRGSKAFESFVRLGLISALIKWKPDAIWGLASAQLAGRGHFTRVGYTVLERGFLRWQWASDGIDPIEYLVAIERPALEAMIDEMNATAVQYPLAQMQKQSLPSDFHS